MWNISYIAGCASLWIGMGIGTSGSGIIFNLNMSGEMHMEGRQDAKVRYSAAYPTGAERIVSG